MINNVVIVSGGRQRDSAIDIHASLLPQTSLPSRLPNNIEQSSLCYSSLLVIHFKYSSVALCSGSFVANEVYPRCDYC